ncbi:MAG: GntR family transcriptional regulator [Brachybacterium sp.]|nr:GntR family transcriptional regulator [Brachybacterium sp.]
MPLPTLRPPERISEQTFEAIHRAIMDGSYAPGHRLRIRDLAAELGTSVMPVREAIGRLEELGLVETQPNRGARVKGFTPTELLHVYSVRRSLEIDAAGAGAAAVTQEDLEALRADLAAMASHLEAGEVVAYLDADEHFLTVLYRAAGNPVLLELIHVLWQRSRSYKIIGAARELDSGNTQALVDFQTRLLGAATDHDDHAARELTAASIDAATDRIRRAIP